MIAPGNPSIDVNELMRRVREEATAMRAREANGESQPATMPVAVEFIAGDNPVDLSRHVVIGSLIEDAARMSRPRSALPKRLERMPYRLGAPFFSFALRLLRYAFKDQAHVNASTQQALRELLRFATTIGGHVAQLSSLAREQRNVARNMATLLARLDASEQRAAELLDLNHVLEARTQAIENALTVNAARIDALEGASKIGTNRIDALERASTTATNRIDALERSSTTGAGRIDLLEGSRHVIEARASGLEAANTISSQRLERLEAAEERTALLNASIVETRRELAAERERALRTEASLRGDVTAIRASSFMPDRESKPAAALALSQYADVHLAIADKFRGESSDIASQLTEYLDVVRGAGTVDAEHPLVDIGSGRAEFLDLCRGEAIPAYGVEIDPLLAERARVDGLDVRAGDGVAALRERDNASAGAVTAFHVIEHLPFESLVAFFDEALRVLAPGGVIVCETPNPANVTIGACNFYLDPTHLHPLPAPLVAFLLELRGFTDVRIVDLQPNTQMLLTEDTEAARRINGFFYSAQNYAAIARKPGASN